MLPNISFPNYSSIVMKNFHKNNRVIFDMIKVTSNMRPQVELIQKYNRDILPKFNNTFEISQQQINNIYKNLYLEIIKPMSELSTQLSEIQTRQARIISQQFYLPVISISSSEKILNEIENDESIIGEAVSSMNSMKEQPIYLETSLYTYDYFNQLFNTISMSKEKYPKTTYTINSFALFIGDFYEQLVYDYLFRNLFGMFPHSIIEKMPLFVFNMFIIVIIKIACQKVIK